MKTVNFEALNKMINDHDGSKLTDIDRAYAKGYLEALDLFVSHMLPDDTAMKNKINKLLNFISVGQSSNSYKVGDQIEINLDGFGVFTATVQKVTEDSVIFMFDDCITVMPMNSTRTNEGGYERSGLCYWINNILGQAFPEEIRKKIMDISIPTYGQIFGHDELYNEYFEPDNDERFELMIDRDNCKPRYKTNRRSYYQNKPEWFWLKNSTKNEISAFSFAIVSYGGVANCSRATSSNGGVRPVFTLSL